MKKNVIHFCLWFLLSNSIIASTNSLPDSDYKKIYTQAEEYFANEYYNAALPLYIRLDSMEKGNANINFKIGFCYLNGSKDKTKSIPYFVEATKKITDDYQEDNIKEKLAPMVTYFYLGKAYQLNYEFDRAISYYEAYKKAVTTTLLVGPALEEVNYAIETCNNARELVSTPLKVTITNLGEEVNSPFPDYSAIVSLDEQTLIFTSRRKDGTSDAKDEEGNYFEDIYISHYVDDKWKKATLIGTNINSKGNEASVNLSADGQKLFVYKDDGGNGNLYLSELKGVEWESLESIGPNINSAAWETHACFTADNNTVYFVSDRPGGFGGRDIYKCLKLPNGEWGIPQNLGATINTQYDEDAVFIHPDGKQIFFSSKGHKSMGGFDIFSSLINDENGFWAPPVNAGYPINTPDDDIFFITTSDGKRAFLSSDKEEGYGDKDIYMLQYIELEPRDITILVGRISNNSPEDISDNQIQIIDIKSNEIFQELIANSATGKFGTDLPIGKSYKIVFLVKGNEIFSEMIDVPKGKGYQILTREIPYDGVKTEIVASQNPSKDSLAGIAKQNEILPEKNPDLAKNKKTNLKNTQIKEAVAKEAPAKGSVPSGKLTPKPCDFQKLSYEIFFKYNKKEIDIASSDFRKFIDELSACILTDSALVIKVEASASRVPTSSYRSNKYLSNARAKKAKGKLVYALLQKGLKESQVNFAKPQALVQGPEYHKDAISNKTEYEKYQYIRINVSDKK